DETFNCLLFDSCFPCSCHPASSPAAASCDDERGRSSQAGQSASGRLSSVVRSRLRESTSKLSRNRSSFPRSSGGSAVPGCQPLDRNSLRDAPLASLTLQFRF